MPASTAGPTITPAVGPWIPTDRATVRRKWTLSGRSERRGSTLATLAPICSPNDAGSSASEPAIGDRFAVTRRRGSRVSSFRQRHRRQGQQLPVLLLIEDRMLYASRNDASVLRVGHRV